MERTKQMIVALFAIIATTFFTASKAYADVIPIPEDVPSIEALIDAHKKMKKAEDLAVLELGAIEETHGLTERVTAAYNKTRTTLNKRLSDGNSYLSLATQIVNVTVKLENLIENYKDFTTLTYQYALKKPYVLVYYTKANYKLSKEIKHLSAIIGEYTASGLGILKATLEEKYRMVNMIEVSISALNRIIWRSDLICRSVIRIGLKSYHIQDLFDKETQELMTQLLIEQWHKDIK